MTQVRVWTWLCVVLTLTACQMGPGEEITSTKPYADLIGAKYIVVADNLAAYGIYLSLDTKATSYIMLLPAGASGPEIAFRRNVPKGQVIRILSAWRQRFSPFWSGVYYLVAIENSDLPQGVPIRLELYTGANRGVGADLNPAVYRKLPRDKGLNGWKSRSMVWLPTRPMTCHRVGVWITPRAADLSLQRMDP